MNNPRWTDLVKVFALGLDASPISEIPGVSAHSIHHQLNNITRLTAIRKAKLEISRFRVKQNSAALVTASKQFLKGDWENISASEETPLLLFEMAKYCQQQNVSFPPEWLPYLLSMCVHSVEYHNSIFSGLGKRAAWLASKRSIWKPLIGQLDYDIWRNHKPETREALIHALRYADVDAAHAFVRRVGDSENAATLSQTLHALRFSVDEEDIPFLEDFVTHSSLQVRRATASLLCLFQDHYLTQEIAGFIVNEMYSKNTNTENAEFNPASQAVRSLGFKTTVRAIGEMSSFLNPTVFELSGQYAPRDILTGNNDVSSGMLKAALYHQNVPWIEAGARLWLENANLSKDWPINKMLATLNQKVYGELLIKSFEGSIEIPEQNSQMYTILENGRMQWSEIASDYISNLLYEWIQDSPPVWEIWKYKKVFQKASYLMPIEKADETLAKLSGTQQLTTTWNVVLIDFENVLKIRKSFRL